MTLVIQSNPIVMVPFQADQWGKILAYFRENHGVELPGIKELQGFGRLRDLRILDKPVDITVDDWIFRFKPGFVTDLGSVPFFFRGVVDNDDSHMLRAVLVHDYNFSTHQLSFETANRLFYDMLIEAGYNWLLSKIAYWAVSSFFGRRRWDKTKVSRYSWTHKTAEFEIIV